MEHLTRRFPHYSKLLRLYPAAYRSEYADQILQTLADMLDNARTPAQKRLVWLRTAVDLPISVTKQQAVYIGGIMTHDTPAYVKRSSIIGSALLAPFFVLFALAALVGHRLQDTWLWNPWVLGVWLVALPAAALLLELVVLTRWLLARREQDHASVWRSLFDLPRTWPLLLVAALGFGIILLAFGHDSVHCVAHNPVSVLRNWHGTWQCIQQR